MEIEENRNIKADTFGMFFRPRPAGLLLGLRNLELRKQGGRKYSTVLARQTNCTYSYAVKILQEMEKKGMIASKKDGRIKIVHLTEKGNEIAGHIERIKAVF